MNGLSFYEYGMYNRNIYVLLMMPCSLFSSHLPKDAGDMKLI